MRFFLWTVGFLCSGAVLAAAQVPPAAGSRSDYKKEVRVSALLTTTRTSADQPIVYPSAGTPQITALRVEVPPGQDTGWHLHTVPGVAYVLAGTLEVETEDGRKHRYGPGDAIVESVQLKHDGRNVGTEPVKLVVFFMGVQGQPFTVRSTRP
jgi:quercetin dioxygenase-like cupin family protein